LPDYEAENDVNTCGNDIPAHLALFHPVDVESGRRLNLSHYYYVKILMVIFSATEPTPGPSLKKGGELYKVDVFVEEASLLFLREGIEG